MFFVIMVPTIILVGIFVSRKREADFISSLNKKEHPLKIFYPLSSVIYCMISKFGGDEWFGSSNVLREIFIDETYETARKKQALRCISSMLVIVLGMCLLTFLYLFSKENYLVDGKYLKRNPIGMGSREYSLVYKDYESGYFGAKKVKIQEVKRNKEEIDLLKKEAECYLIRTVLSENTSADVITEKLNLVTEIPGMGIRLKWDNSNHWIVSVNGELRNREITEPVRIELHAELNYYDEKWDFVLPVRIMPYVPEYGVVVSELIDTKISENNEKTLYDDYFELPSELPGSTLVWEEPEDNTVQVIIILGLISLVVVIPLMKQELRKKQKVRSERLLHSYSDVVSKFVMLLTAGMTCRASWDKICTDYLKDKKKEKYKEQREYAYEEMLISNNELRLGKPEVRVYEDFGIRCNVAQYQRFGTLLARNVKRGSAGIIAQLELESAEAFAERRNAVKRKGEEAGTKLLMPMFGMLIIVFVMVLVPAFTNL